MKHLLIDFENIQPKNLNNVLEIEDACIWIFLGALHKNISIELCQSLLNFKGKVHFVKLKKTGKNALDFYLSFYLGRIIQQDPEAQIAILAKDCGYDILVEHIINHYPSVKIKRIGESIHFEQSLKVSPQKPQESLHSPSPPKSTLKNLELARPQDLYQTTKRYLIATNSFHPTLYHNLKEHLNQHLFPKHFSAWQEYGAEKTIAQLIEKGYLSLDGATINYHLDKINESLKKCQPKQKTKNPNTIEKLLKLNHPPSTKQSLKNWLQTHHHTNNNDEIDQLIHQLQQEGKIIFSGKKIHYPQKSQTLLNQNQKQHLKKILQSKNRPKTQNTLINTLKSRFKLNDESALELIKQLSQENTLKIDDKQKIHYHINTDEKA